MIITYLRSSSIKTWLWCQQKYFLSYNLGYREPSNKKADKGTICHKVFEIMAISRQAELEGKTTFADDILGTDIPLRIIDDIEWLTDKVYDYYIERMTNHKWTDADRRECIRWVKKALSYNQGTFDPRNLNVISPEIQFDIEIKRSWAKYDVGGHAGYLRLKGTIDLVTEPAPGTFEIIDWKGLPVETPIPTPNGWTTMGQLQVGDTVYDKDGQSTKVIGKSTRNFKTCYKIEFDDTTSAICDNEHLWMLSNGNTVPITSLQIGDTIDVAKPLDGEHRELPIDPYVLGVWIGDGRNRNGEITSSDEEIFELIRKRGYKLGEDTEPRYDTIQIRTIVGLTSKLRKLGLLHNKHIPQIYLRASYQQRLDLLRGLMDSDGNANVTRKQAVFTTCNQRLSNDVKELLLSLGQRVNQASIIRSTNFKDNVHVYPLAFRPIGINPFSLTRKAAKIDPQWGPGKSNVRRITSITKLNVELETQCIMVDSPSNTYLCTENMIPTHNTGRRWDWGSDKEKDYQNLRDDIQLRMYHYAMSHVYPEAENLVFTIFYINDGGAWSIPFGKPDLVKTEGMLRKHFQDIRDSELPTLTKSWKCTKLCHFGKTRYPGSSQTICEFIHSENKKKGMDRIVKDYTRQGHDVTFYKAPGEVE